MATYVYAPLDSIKKYHDMRVLVQLTNDDDTVDPDVEDNIDEDVLSSAESEAATTIGNYLRNVYDNLPLAGSDLTEEIIAISAHLTWCTLWERRGEEPEQVTRLRERMLTRLKEMGEPGSAEVRGRRSTALLPRRSTKGKVRTVFDHAGYFDGIPSQGTRRLAGDSDGESGN